VPSVIVLLRRTVGVTLAVLAIFGYSLREGPQVPSQAAAAVPAQRSDHPAVLRSVPRPAPPVADRRTGHAVVAGASLAVTGSWADQGNVIHRSVRRHT
jgi:hypothetical protein